ncbi:glycosyltransferase family A protein [Hydrogenophaga sp.]|uniref:glycosyltransferase family 2 protein n=1 Tax=Hydrogenophaga sp. TaxID=1904254 RepID=UPI00262ADD20|nr:glycosyltransferase family A protein [Hydrogenophaga sp.]MCW5652283.1 glycosyltransferase family 2 protein [Hydrogenophaga sp.]
MAQPNYRSRVSIGLPVFNGEKYLPQTIESLLAQTFDDFELIISDNASTDRTAEICRAYAERDARVRYHRNEANIGLYRNFNRVFQLSSSAYFKWAAADDICGARLIERCVEVLDADPQAVLVYAKTVFIDEQQRELVVDYPGWHLPSPDPVERMAFAIQAGHWVTACEGLIRSSALRQTPLFPTYYGGDRALLCRLALFGTFQELPERLAFKRLHASNSTGHASDADWFPDKAAYQSWTLYRDYLKIIAGSPFSLSQKTRLLKAAARRMYWSKSSLRQEMRQYVRNVLRSGDS